jgi:hypothetical protein
MKWVIESRQLMHVFAQDNRAIRKGVRVYGRYQNKCFKKRSTLSER